MELKRKYEKFFDFGMAVMSNSMFIHGEEIFDDISTLTCENEMKWAYAEKEKDIFLFDGNDIIANFARKKGMKLRAHTILWHQVYPEWLFDEVKEKTNLEKRLYALERMEVYLVELIKNYGDIIFAIDVANEVISDEDEYIYRPKSIYYQICDSNDETFEKFLAEVFKMVKRVAPNVIRYYNDYRMIGNHIKRRKAIKFVENINKYGADCQGFGMQCHLNIKNTKEEIEDGINEVRKLGLEISLTEVDICMHENHESKEFVLTKEKQEELADLYEKLFLVLRSNCDVIKNVTFWGVSDKGSWLNNFFVKNRRDYPLLFDDKGNRKEAYYRILNIK